MAHALLMRGPAPRRWEGGGGGGRGQSRHLEPFGLDLGSWRACSAPTTDADADADADSLSNLS